MDTDPFASAANSYYMANQANSSDYSLSVQPEESGVVFMDKVGINLTAAGEWTFQSRGVVDTPASTTSAVASSSALSMSTVSATVSCA